VPELAGDELEIVAIARRLMSAVGTANRRLRTAWRRAATGALTVAAWLRPDTVTFAPADRGTQTSIHRDGVLRRSDSYVDDITPARPAPLRIGARDLAGFSQASIRRVRSWSRARGSDEVAALLPSTRRRRTGWWPNTCSITRARDTAGAAHDGVILGVSWLPDQAAL
jgi:hypothetical protein